MSKNSRPVNWEEFYDERFDQIMVSVERRVLASDEAIVAVLGHEVFELERLRSLFAQRGGSMGLRELYDLIRTRNPGNLHDLAWEHADRLVAAMRRNR